MNIYANAYKNAAKQASDAKNGTATINGATYTFTFDRSEWVYAVTDTAGDTVVRLNCKSLAKAKRELNTWLNA